jgi:hypothetical protein
VLQPEWASRLIALFNSALCYGYQPPHSNTQPLVPHRRLTRVTIGQENLHNAATHTHSNSAQQAAMERGGKQRTMVVGGEEGREARRRSKGKHEKYQRLCAHGLRLSSSSSLLLCVCCYSPPLLLLSPWPPLLALNRRICLRLLMYLFRGLLLLIDARLYVVCYWLAGWLLTHHGAF